MNQDIERIYMRYVKNYKFKNSSFYYLFRGEFFNSSPVYECYANYVQKKLYKCYIENNRLMASMNYDKDGENYICYKVFDFFDQKIFSPITIRMKYFDYGVCDEFKNYKSKEILRTIFLCFGCERLGVKLNNDCVFIVLSFIRKIELGYLL